MIKYNDYAMLHNIIQLQNSVVIYWKTCFLYLNIFSKLNVDKSSNNILNINIMLYISRTLFLHRCYPVNIKHEMKVKAIPVWRQLITFRRWKKLQVIIFKEQMCQNNHCYYP